MLPNIPSDSDGQSSSISFDPLQNTSGIFRPSETSPVDLHFIFLQLNLQPNSLLTIASSTSKLGRAASLLIIYPNALCDPSGKKPVLDPIKLS